VVDIFNALSNNWTTTTLSQAHKDLVATSIGNLALFAGGDSEGLFAMVDIFNASSNNWTTTMLSQAHTQLVATSIGNLALFAGSSISAELQCGGHLQCIIQHVDHHHALPGPF
jgi:hypothetical protein